MRRICNAPPPEEQMTLYTKLFSMSLYRSVEFDSQYKSSNARINKRWDGVDIIVYQFISDLNEMEQKLLKFNQVI